MSRHEPAEAYEGGATVTIDGTDHEVAVTLRGAFQPINGVFQWYGRIAATSALEEVGNRRAVTLRTPHGIEEAQLGNPDAWGRYRISGTGHPPF